MAWIPRNKTTGVEYPAIDDATKAQWESDPMLKGKYTYKKTGDAAKPVTKAVPAKEDTPKKPIGVPDPEIRL
jgi:hypothetical protein